MDTLRILFSHICGQQHLWTLGGITLPFCQRCTGLYVGAFLAVAIIAILRPRPDAWVYWLHGSFMLLMFPFGFHLLPHGGLVRTFTGTLFAFGLVYFLLLNPVTAWLHRDRNWSPVLLRYFLSIGLAAGAILIAVSYGAATLGRLLTALGLVGFACLALLIVANLIVLPSIIRSLLHRPASLIQ